MGTLQKKVISIASGLDQKVRDEHGDGIATIVEGQYARVRKTGQPAATPDFLIMPGLEVLPDDRVFWFQRGQLKLIYGVLSRNAFPSDTSDPGFINVMDHGVVGDGVSDDTGPFAEALDAAPEGGIVFVPPDTTILTSLFTLPLRTTLRGAGMTSVIKLKDDSNSSLIVAPVSPGPTLLPISRIEHLLLDGNKANNTGTDPGVDISAWHMVMHNVYVQDFSGDGIFVRSGAGGQYFEEVYVARCGRDGFVFDSSDIIALRCWSALNGRDGFVINRATVNITGGMTFWNRRGIMVSDGAGMLTVEGIGIDRNLEAGAYIDDDAFETSWLGVSFNGNGQRDVVPVGWSGISPPYTPIAAGRHPHVEVISTEGSHSFVGCYFNDYAVAVWPEVVLATSLDADDIINTVTPHGFVAGDRIGFVTKTGGSSLALGDKVTSFANYYVIAANLGANTFQISDTLGGAAKSLGSNITAGTVGLYIRPDYDFKLATGAVVTVSANQHSGSYSVALANTLLGVRTQLAPGVHVGADNVVQIIERTAPGTPPSGTAYLYLSSVDGVLHLKNDAGSDTAI